MRDRSCFLQRMSRDRNTFVLHRVALYGGDLFVLPWYIHMIEMDHT